MQKTKHETHGKLHVVRDGEAFVWTLNRLENCAGVGEPNV